MLSFGKSLPNFLVLILFLTTSVSYSSTPSAPQPESPLISIESSNSLAFEDPEFADAVLQVLDVFDYDPTNFYHNRTRIGKVKPIIPANLDDEYCDKHRTYFTRNSKLMFNQTNFVTNHWKNAPFRQRVLPKIGVDLIPKWFVGAKIKGVASPPIETNIFFIFEILFGFAHVGKHFSCLSQMSNHIPGHNSLYRKDYVGQVLTDYAKNYTTRPQCFGFSKFFPKTWVLYQEDQCREFFNEFNSDDSKEDKKQGNIMYIRKIGVGVHEGQGVFLVNSKEDQYIRDKYKNGDLCGKVKNNNIMQRLIRNPLLINGHKFDFRIFMLIASTNPVMAYYHDGYLRLSLYEYDANSEDAGGFVTNTAISKPLFRRAKKEGSFRGMTEAQLKEKSHWNFTQLADYLLEQGMINDPNWLDNYLRPQFKKAMVHLIRMSQHTLLQRSSLFELYGLDFMMDSNLDLWFIESNARPLLNGWTDETNDFFTELLSDEFEIVIGLLKSRVKRIVNYVNNLQRTGQASLNDSKKVDIQDIEGKKAEFKKISANYFEPEYEPSNKNGFSIIIDENKEGVEKYFGLLEENCL